MKRLIRKSQHDVETRDMAIVCIDGKVYEDHTHALAIQEYLDENEIDSDGILDEDNPEYNRPESADVGSEAKIAIAHRVDFEQAIYLEAWSLHNMTQDEAVGILKSEYPNYDIYNDDDYDEDSDEYTKIASLIQRIKKRV